MAFRLLVSILACAGRPALALLLQEEENQNPLKILFGFTTSPPDQAYDPSMKKVKVLVYGDRWGDIGFGPGILETMFHERFILADVRHIQRSSAGACSMANEPPAGQSLVSGIKQAFGEEVPDYVWYLAGAVDLMGLKKYDHPTECKLEPVDADACLKASVTQGFNYCTDTMLKAMWAVYPEIRVVQSGYDFPCTEGLACGAGAAMGASKDHFCPSGDQVCQRKNLAVFFKYLLGSEFHDIKGHEEKYKGIDILGTMQAAHSYPGVSIGKPDFTRGSPCSDILFCLWPLKGSKGYKALADAFWELYFKEYEAGLAQFSKFKQGK